jgi:hypothetical protein
LLARAIVVKMTSLIPIHYKFDTLANWKDKEDKEDKEDKGVDLY